MMQKMASYDVMLQINHQGDNHILDEQIFDSVVQSIIHWENFSLYDKVLACLLTSRQYKYINESLKNIV